MNTPDDVTLEFLKHALHEHILKIKFKKVNGEERVMRCTRMPNSLPETANESSRGAPPGLIVVYDVDKNGWRSFYLSSIESISVEDNE